MVYPIDKAIFVVGFLAACGLRSLTGSEPEISDRSPDKKYALWQKYVDKQPYLGDVKLIDSKNREARSHLGRTGRAILEETLVGQRLATVCLL